MATYKAVMRPALEYASSIWWPLASSSNINKLQVMPNAALRTATGCTQYTNIQHLHAETLVLPPYTSIYSTTPHNTNKNTTSITSLTQTYNILQHSKAKTLSSTTAATQQTFPQTPTQSLQQTYKQTCAIYIHLLSLGT